MSGTLLRGGATERECAALAPLLAGDGRALAPDVARHLETCPSCRATATTLARVAGAGAREPVPDLWPRLAERLADMQAHVVLPVPGFSWGVAVAAVVTVTAPLLVNEPGRLLFLMLGMV